MHLRNTLSTRQYNSRELRSIEYDVLLHTGDLHRVSRHEVDGVRDLEELGMHTTRRRCEWALGCSC